MNNRRDKSPTYDYDELQRRHNEYKERKRQEMLKKSASSEAPADPVEKTVKPVAAPASEAAPVQTEMPAPAEVEEELQINFSEEEPMEAPIESEDDIPVADISGEEFTEDEGEIVYEDAEDMPRQNPNPFDSFFSVFSKLKGKFSRKKTEAYEGEDAYGDYEDEFSEDNLPPAEDDVIAEDYADAPAADYSEDFVESVPAGDYAEEAPAEDYAEDFVEETPAPRRQFSFRRKAEPVVEDYAAEDIAEDTVEDIGEAAYAPVYSDDQPAYDEGYEEDYAEESYDEYPEEDYGDDFEAAPVKKVGKFGKFIRLFVVPVDEDEMTDEDEDDEYSGDESYSEGEYDYADAAEYDEYDDEPIMTEYTRPGLIMAEDEIEGGLDNMADLNRINPELSKALAADLETPGMSRRERRELAERLAAEEAARKAEEAKAAAAEAAETVEAAPVAELFTEEPLEADVVSDVSSGIVEIEEAAPSIDVSVVDEPTREFKPVSKMSFDEYMEAVEDAETEEEEEEEPVRKGLFGRRKAKKVVEEVEDDYDDEEYDEEEYDEEEEEEVEEKPRKGLFGRRKSKKVVEEEYDDEEDEEDYDEYDDYDEEEEEEPVKRSRKSRRNDRYDDEDDYEDDYDEEYEDDYDDEYEDDEDDYDEGGSSFGRAILRFFIVIISLVLIAAIALLSANILNVIDVISLTPLAERMPEQLVDVLLFSEETKHMLADEVAEEGDLPASVEDADTVVVPEITLEDVQPETEAEADEAADEPVEEAEETVETETISEPTVG